jgi:hypothetical protein
MKKKEKEKAKAKKKFKDAYTNESKEPIDESEIRDPTQGFEIKE